MDIITEKKSITEYDPLIIKDTDDNHKYYGGNQSWYNSKTMAYAGCGSVAGANMLRILASKYPDEFTSADDELRNLINKDCYKAPFIKLMGSIYKTMFVFEVPIIRKIYDYGMVKNSENRLLKLLIPSFGMSICGFIKGVLKFTKQRGLLLHSNALPTAFVSKNKGLDFIKKGLRVSGSVVILTSLNRHPLKLYSGECGRLEKGYDSQGGMKSHFALITGVENRDGKDIVRMSTWGRVATVTYDELNKSWQSPLAFTSCLFYFVPVKSERIVRKDMAFAVYVLIKAVLRGMFGWI